MSQEHGSAKLIARMLGSAGAPTRESVAAAVAEVKQGSFRILDWHVKGQPAIDRIKALIEVTPQELAPAVQGLTALHGAGRSVVVDVFPLGVPVLDRIQLQVTADVTVR